MTLTSIGDLATSLTLRRQSTSLKQEIDRLTLQLASGRLDPAQLRQSGRSYVLTDMEAGLTRIGAYGLAAAEAETTASAMQASLAQLNTQSDTLVGTLLGTTLSAESASGEQASVLAGETLPGLIGALNVSMASRSLFSGTSTDTPPLGSADDLLAGLRTAIAGLGTVADIRVAATAWFDDPAGFDAQVYGGAADSAAAIRISETGSVALDIRADDPAIKSVLRETALAALAGDPVLGLSPLVATDLRASAGTGLAAAQTDLTALQARLGIQQARIEEAGAQNAAAQLGYETARNQIMAADPFDVATQLDAAQVQLQALYSVTARTSSLRLVNFL